MHYAAAVTLLAALLYAASILLVGWARWRYGVKAPTITGHPDFERAYRVQVNTLEQMPIFLPSLWLAAFYFSDQVAAILGLVFIAFRILYAVLYLRAAGSRGYAYAPGALCMFALWSLAVWGLLRSLGV
jgi:glutathione S-transferase